MVQIPPPQPFKRKGLLISEKFFFFAIINIHPRNLAASFLCKISSSKNINLVPVEQIGVETVIDLKNRTEKGEFVFIAGDRTSKNNRNVEVEVCSFKVDFPLGTFKLAELLELPVFFISCLKSKIGYDMIVKRAKNASSKQMAVEFSDFVTEQIKQAHFQFYHFCEFFK